MILNKFKMPDGFKLDDNSALVVDVVMREGIDPIGRPFKQVKRISVDKDWINLGSMKKPKNEKIIRFEWIDTSPTRPWFDNMFEE